MKYAQIWLLGLILYASVVHLGCATDQGLTPGESELLAARENWQTMGISHYEYRFHRSCYCPPEVIAPVFIEVRDGEIQTIRYADSGEPVDSLNYDSFMTVEELFGLVQSAIDQPAEILSAAYDPELGYPRSIDIDYRISIFDEEIYIKTSDLRPLEP